MTMIPSPLQKTLFYGLAAPSHCLPLYSSGVQYGTGDTKEAAKCAAVLERIKTLPGFPQKN